MVKPFFVWQNKVLKSIDPLTVACLFTEKNYTRIFLWERPSILVRTTLSTALKKLPPDMFIKTHRSWAVSVYYINDIARDHLVVGGEPVPIARQYYDRVIEQLNILG